MDQIVSVVLNRNREVSLRLSRRGGNQIANDLSG
jgi:hypothetical protein